MNSRMKVKTATVIAIAGRVRLPGCAHGLHQGVIALDGRRVLCRADQDLVLGEQGVDVAAQLDTGGGQQDEMVARSLQVGHQMRGQHDGQAAVRHRLGQMCQELPPG
jgi:hypothetical protein